VCYDRGGLESRKEHRPDDRAVDMAAAIGVELLTDIRQRGGALFGDRRYGHVFVYHNGTQSYYGVRAFRASLRV